jgi:hypothetical protein
MTSSSRGKASPFFKRLRVTEPARELPPARPLQATARDLLESGGLLHRETLLAPFLLDKELSQLSRSARWLLPYRQEIWQWVLRSWRKVCSPLWP